jgi:hypothetical protein
VKKVKSKKLQCKKKIIKNKIALKLTKKITISYVSTTLIASKERNISTILAFIEINNILINSDLDEDTNSKSRVKKITKITRQSITEMFFNDTIILSSSRSRTERKRLTRYAQ